MCKPASDPRSLTKQIPRSARDFACGLGRPQGGSTWFRQYASSQGRWLTADPLGLGSFDLSNPQSVNLYVYVLDNPVNLIDPPGLCGENGDGHCPRYYAPRCDGVIFGGLACIPTGLAEFLLRLRRIGEEIDGERPEHGPKERKPKPKPQPDVSPQKQTQFNLCMAREMAGGTFKEFLSFSADALVPLPTNARGAGFRLITLGAGVGGLDLLDPEPASKVGLAVLAGELIIPGFAIVASETKKSLNTELQNAESKCRLEVGE